MVQETNEQPEEEGVAVEDAKADGTWEEGESKATAPEPARGYRIVEPTADGGEDTGEDTPERERDSSGRYTAGSTTTEVSGEDTLSQLGLGGGDDTPDSPD